MVKKNIIKIINEEIVDFDFLNNEKENKSKENWSKILNTEIQKQFIVDSISHRNKIKIIDNDIKIGGNYDSFYDEASWISIEYVVKIQYNYNDNENPIIFTLAFYSDKVEISEDGVYVPAKISGLPEDSYPEEYDAWIDYVDWLDIDVILSGAEFGDDEIRLNEFDKAPSKIKILFIKSYVKDIIESKTKLDVKY